MVPRTWCQIELKECRNVVDLSVSGVDVLVPREVVTGGNSEVLGTLGSAQRLVVDVILPAFPHSLPGIANHLTFVRVADHLPMALPFLEVVESLL